MPIAIDSRIVVLDTSNSVTVANGAAVSGAFDLNGFTLGVIIVPNNLTATTTQIGFQLSIDGANYYDDYVTSGALYTIAVPLFTGSTTSGTIRLPLGMYAGIRGLKLVMYNSSNAQVLQSGAKTLYVGGRTAA